MSENIFGHIFKARELAFGVSGKRELAELKSQVSRKINCPDAELDLRFLMFKVTNRCNSNCAYCDYSRANRLERRRRDLSGEERIPFEAVSEVLKQASSLNALACALNGGEPLLRKDISKIVSRANQNGILPIIMTNGLLLNRLWEDLGAAGLKYLMISLDSLREPVFRLHRGVSLPKTLEGVESALRMRDRFGDMVIHITAVVSRYNLDDLEALAEYAKCHGIWLEICAYHHMSDGKDELSATNETRLREVMDRLLALKSRGYPISTSKDYIDHMVDFCVYKKKKPDAYQCLSGFTTLQVDGFLNVRPCWDQSFNVMGNLGETSLSEIWLSRKMEEYRQKMLAGKCVGCWNMCNEATALFKELEDDFESGQV